MDQLNQWNQSYQGDIPHPDKIRNTDFGRTILRWAGQADNTLEPGAGSGKFSFMLSYYGYDATVTDYNDSVINTLQSKTEQIDSSVTVKKEDITDMSLPDGSYDFVFNEGVVEHFLGSDRESAIREMGRVSCSRVLIFVPHSQSLWYQTVDRVRGIIPEQEYAFTFNELRDLTEKAGITVQEMGKVHRGRQIYVGGTV